MQTKTLNVSTYGVCELNYSEVININGGSTATYEAGKSHGAAFRTAVDDAALLIAIVAFFILY
jgi:hypothetical protein